MSRRMQLHAGVAPDTLIGGTSLEELTRRHDAYFASLSETEQILYSSMQELTISYGVYAQSDKTREEVARAFLERRFGKKFTDRVLTEDACRALLKVDETPSRAEVESLATI